ncbi:hypothetical protein BKA62DRAFT_773988 [Auriculariales sp. MPI-PUGE-AT-0066]|nr:hypothetical protein BKA62DRAFT_773988 [Auriculariales sp. MPI-PUGE-AT-0066]
MHNHHSNCSLDAIRRPRSADLGGLALAVRGEGSGAGWGGWDNAQTQNTAFAEILAAMHTETARILDLPVNLPWPVQPTPGRHAELVRALDSWEFAPWKLSDGEVLYCAELLFASLLRVRHLARDIGGVTIGQLRPFLRQLCSIYRPANQYHNFRHALDVLQSTFTFLTRVGLVPTMQQVHKLRHGEYWTRKASSTSNLLHATLRNVDIFVLYLVAIGHDVGHPGLSNMFLKNADTPLSTLYNGDSPLERMHIFFLTQLMRRHGMGGLLVAGGTGVTASESRHLLIETLLVTDLRVHFDWMGRFGRLRDPALVANIVEHERRVLLCQGLLKGADISNPLRPPHLSEHWSDVLHEEWTSQAGLEIYLDQPVSMAAAAGDDRRKADAQIGFIDTFVGPLFKVLSDVIPEMQEFATCCSHNKQLWIARSSQAASVPSSVAATSASTAASSSTEPEPEPEPEVDASKFDAWFRSVFPLSLPPGLLETEVRTGRLVPAEPPVAEPTIAPPTSGFASPVLSPSDAHAPGSSSLSPGVSTHKRLSISGVLDLDPTPKFPNPASFEAARAGKRSSVPGLFALIGGVPRPGSGASSLVHSPALVPVSVVNGLGATSGTSGTSPPLPLPPLLPHGAIGLGLSVVPAPAPASVPPHVLGANGYGNLAPLPPPDTLGMGMGTDGRQSLASWRTGSFASTSGYTSSELSGGLDSSDFPTSEDNVPAIGGAGAVGRWLKSSSTTSMVALGSSSASAYGGGRSGSISGVIPPLAATSEVLPVAKKDGRETRARSGVMVVRDAFRAAVRAGNGGWLRGGGGAAASSNSAAG